MPPVLDFNTLYKAGMYATGQVPQDDMKAQPIPMREPPNGSLNVAQPQQLPAPKPSESAEAAMEPQDFKTEVVIPPEETRSDQKTEAQKEAEQLNRETGGSEARAKFAEREARRKGVDENVTVDSSGQPVWEGPESEQQFVRARMQEDVAGLAQGAGRAAGAVGAAAGTAAYEAGAATLGPGLNATKQQIEDVAQGVSSSITGAVTQLNTMLIILAGAYVLGQAVSGK